MKGDAIFLAEERRVNEIPDRGKREGADEEGNGNQGKEGLVEEMM